MKRSTFIKSSFILGTGISLIGCLNEENTTGPIDNNWNAGDLAHILPTLNHQRMLISTSFRRVVNQPILKVGNRSFEGQMRDSKGFFWAFDCPELEAETEYELQLFEANVALCDSWPLKTFPKPSSDPEHLRLMIYSCAGGHPKVQDMLPVPDKEKESPDHFARKRIELLHRGISLNPDALIIIGDTVYWDLNGNGKKRLGTMQDPRAIDLAGKFDESLPILGTENEEVLKRVVSPQIIDLYGTACRSTPIFIFNDDHDYFENDEANDAIVTFPPKAFQLALGRAVQQLYFPEFLPDENRPLDLPGSGAADRVEGSSEAFGTLRYGKLAELLMYDCRRFVDLNGTKAVFVPEAAENWLIKRSQSQDIKHCIHVPSTPYGWSAGKWLEWYPDILGQDGVLHDDLPKYMWKRGWQNQHNRILSAMHEAKFRKPVTISGDLHTFASGRIYRNGDMDFESNPIHAFIAGALGCTVFPSTFRKIKASTPNAIYMEEDFENVEENGFSIVDIDSRNIKVDMYKYLWSRDDLDEIAELAPFQKLST